MLELFNRYPYSALWVGFVAYLVLMAWLGGLVR